MTTPEISTQAYNDFRRYLEDASGIVVGDDKHYLVISRLNRMMREFQIVDFSHLMAQLKEQRTPKLHQRIVDALATQETLWFRDSYPFEVMKHELLPEISQNEAGQLRIWSAACASGQEAYSISMTIQEYLSSRAGPLPDNTQIIGTDISTTMLRHASEALYDKMSLSHGISEAHKQRFFMPLGDQWQLRPEIKSRASFHQLNRLNSFSALGKFDIIFCRNVLLYFSSETKSDILNRMTQSLNPGGYLFLGGSESPASYSKAYEVVRTAGGVDYRVK